MRKLHRFTLASAIACATTALASAAYASGSISGRHLATGITGPIAGGKYNPAAPAALAKAPNAKNHGFMFTAGGGIEYGNVDEIFELLDDVADALQSADHNGGTVTPPPANEVPDEPVTLPANPTLADIVANNPQYQAWFDAIAAQSSFIASSLAIVRQEAYAKAYLDADLPILITNNLWGGSLVFSTNTSASSKAQGVVDQFEFDIDRALEVIERARDLDPNDPITELQLSDDVQMTVNPLSGNVSFAFTNDSLLLTKAAQINEVSLSYSRAMLSSSSGTLFGGVKPKYLNVGLSQVDTRFGDLTDSEALFDDIRNATFRRASDFSIDFGAVWVAENYSVGATLYDPFGPEFLFPDVDETKYKKPELVEAIRRESRWELKPQLELEAALFTASRNWQISTSIETNDVDTPVGDTYQWFGLGGAYTSSKFYIPDLRLTYRQNMAGNNLKFVGAGITLFKVLNIDLSTALNSIDIDGQTLPRGGNLSAGIQVMF